MQSSGWEPEGSEDSLIASLFSIGRTMRRVGAESTDPHTYWLLHSLRLHGTVRVTDLACAMQLDTSTISRQVSQLVKSGLVQRSQDPDDGRAQVVTITADGERLLDDAHADRRRFVTDRMADWDREDVETLNRLLTRFATSVSAVRLDRDDDPRSTTDSPAPGSTGPLRQLENA